MSRRNPAPRVTGYDTTVFPEGTAVHEDEQPRTRTSQAHGRAAANAVIAATSGKPAKGEKNK